MKTGFFGRCVFGAGLLGVLISCATSPLAPTQALAPLWRPVSPAGAAATLKIEPANSAARLGESARLRVLSSEADTVSCQTADGEPLGGDAQGLVVPAPAVPSPVTVVCQAAGARAEAQVTFTDSRTLPLADPYAGAVVLFKLRELPDPWTDAKARDSLGLRSLDATLERLGAVVVPAFPFDRTGVRDAVGLGLWVAIDIPPGVNFYQAVSWLRSDPSIYPESYLPEDGGFLRVQANGAWPTAFTPITRLHTDRDDEYKSEVRLATAKRAQVNDASPDLDAIGAPQVWGDEQGENVRIAVIDTGVDVNHAAISPNLHDKPNERMGDDFDGNGVPGDRYGVNLAHLAIAHGPDGARLGLGVVSGVGDWDGSTERTRRDWGHGTALASIAAGGAAGLGSRLGVAPRAQIFAVDVQEDLRTTLTPATDADPRMSDAEHPPAALRSSVWARAAGVAYAVGERARVITCAWPGQRAHLVLHDALLYAEDNCAIPVCAAASGKPADAATAYPASWRDAYLAKHGGEMGTVWDPWTDTVTGDPILRPLRATVVTAPKGIDAGDPDLVLPLVAGRPLEVSGASSNPRNDGSRVPDRRAATVDGSTAAVGLTAGAAAIVTGARPDLEPWAVRQALVNGAARASNGPALSVPGALAVAGKEEQGACAALLRREPTPEASSWPQIKVRTKASGPLIPGEEQPPASPNRGRQDSTTRSGK
jgi:hypothetical protein